MSNILYVLYHDFSASSAVHVHYFANGLAARGHATAVTFPAGEDIGAGLGRQSYAVAAFPRVDGNWSLLFPNGQPPDLVHAWTPRENVRLFCEKLRGLCAFTLFVHLEDNEEIILEKNLGTPFAELARSETISFPGNLSHPRNYRRFLAAASGITMIMDRLEKFAPAGRPAHILWPGADLDLFRPQPKDEALRASLGIPAGDLVFCYTGNVHSANAREMRSLYLAVAILDREGTPATLLRAGKDYVPFLGPDESWAGAVSVDLGHVHYEELPPLLSLADVLVQPGTDNAFNEYRLPAKLPDFFAMGRPVVLPQCNLGRFVRHGEDAWVAAKADALGIMEAVQTLRRQPELAARLGAAARAFATRHFDWKNNAAGLDAFYAEVLARTHISQHDKAVAIS